VVEVYVSIGSNIDREKHIRDAITGMRREFGELRLSPVYETAAVGFDGPPFYNLVAGFNADDLAAIRQQLVGLEQLAQRQRSATKFSSRTLDLDILLFGDADLHHDGFDIPRAEILRYAFVLKPLSDLAPDVRYPGSDKTIQQLWREFCERQPQSATNIQVIDLQDL